MKLSVVLLSFAVAAAACGDEREVETNTVDQASVRDAGNGGSAGVYFLGAYGRNIPNPFPGTFDAAFKSNPAGQTLSVEFQTLANCSNSDNVTGVHLTIPASGILLYTNIPAYQYNRNAATIGLVNGQCYRMAIKLGSTVAGHSDIHVTTGAAATGYTKVTPTGNIQVQFRLETSLRTDTDGDTVQDWRDNCPTTANTNQADSNNNGIGDACEVADADADGVPDSTDNCPNFANPGQENTDGDSAGDACDLCSSDNTKIVPGACGCGVPDTDGDGDSTPDCIDGCPMDMTKTSPGACGCGIPDTDSDGDTVPNCIDGCPTDGNKTAAGQCGCGTPDTDSDNDGRANCVEVCTP